VVERPGFPVVRHDDHRALPRKSDSRCADACAR
jgi:hypothetical protein